MFVVTLYVEGGPLDGDTFACGPFASVTEAEANRDALTKYGQADVHDLELNASAIARYF